MKPHNLYAAIVLSLTVPALTAHADPAEPSRHKLYRECMAKQKEADSGKNHDDMKAFCEDYAKTQREAEKEQTAPPPPKTGGF